MAIAGSGGWLPSARVSIHRRQMRLQYPFHNVPREVVWHPEHAAAFFLDRAEDGEKHAGIYVPLTEWGGTEYLYELLVEVGLIDEIKGG